MIEPSVAQLAYCAGIIDGEGCIDIQVAKPKGIRKTPSYRLRIKVSMCLIDSIEVLMACFGGTAKHRSRKNPRHRPIWEWAIHNTKAKRALVLMLPYLILKKTQAELGISLVDRLEKFKIVGPVRQTPFWELDARRKIYERIQSRNARGTVKLILPDVACPQRPPRSVSQAAIL